MEVYQVNPVFDNPLFNGLAMRNSSCLEAWPLDWMDNYTGWEVRRLKAGWEFPAVFGKVEEYNDYPCVNLIFPALSIRAVDKLGSTLEEAGEILKLNCEVGDYYFFNCTRLENCLDMEKTKLERIGKGFTSSLDSMVFIPSMIEELAVFKIRTQPSRLFCTTNFIKKVRGARLQGFSFLKVWPLPEGRTLSQEMIAEMTYCKKLRPFGVSKVNIVGQSMVIRLFTKSKIPSKLEQDMSKKVANLITQNLVTTSSGDGLHYFGSLEEINEFDGEIRLHISCPDVKKLVEHLKSSLVKIDWKSNWQVCVSRKEWNPFNLNKDCKELNIL